MMETPKFAVEIAAEGIEILAVAIILAGLGLGTVWFLLHSIFNRSGYELQPVQGNSRQSSTLGLEHPRGGRYRADSRSRAYYHKHHRLGPAGFGPHFLSWSLFVELEERWPWQPARRQSDEPGN
jgi:hypothetical protein